ncbi:MAG: DUF4440 domain-containing protein [Terriglobales bacterium]
MRDYLVFICMVGMTSLALAQSTAVPAQVPEGQKSTTIATDSGLKDMFEAKIKAEWEALKNKDKKAYAELLADDYQGVEIDGLGERNKIQAVNELVGQNVFSYSLWGYKFFPLGPDAALVIYESTMQFPPTAQIRYSRVYISEIWVKRAGQWKILHYQETRVK